MYYNEAEEIYKRAKQEGDTETLKEFAEYGKGECQMIKNYCHYKQYQECGFKDEPSYNDYGWCNNNVPDDDIETIPLWEGAFLEVAQLPNGKWVCGTSYMLSQSGCSSSASIFSRQYSSRTKAVDTAITDIEDRIKRGGTKGDQKYIPVLEKVKGGIRQLSLF